MPKPLALVIYDKCEPEKCSPDTGECEAENACSRNILKQEEAFESPILFPSDMCQGCGDCTVACPLDAIKLADV